MSWTKYAIFLAAILLAIWLLHRKGISRFHIALIVLSYLVIIALIFLALILIVDRNLATTKGLLRFSQKSLRLAHHDGEHRCRTWVSPLVGEKDVARKIFPISYPFNNHCRPRSLESALM